MENNFEYIVSKLESIGWGERYEKCCEFDELLGKTITKIEGAEKGSECIWIACSDGSEYVMHHDQDCCEDVAVESVDGELDRLIGRPLTMAEVVTNSDTDETNDGPLDKWDDSFTWTYYKLATVMGYVTIRWYGTSNGYYSESVDVLKIK